MDPQAASRDTCLAGVTRGTWGTLARPVRRLLHTGIPLGDSRAALFPIVPSPYSYNL